MVLQLCFITTKGHKAKSVEEEGTWGKVQRKPGESFQECFPSGVTKDTLNSSSRVVTTRGKVYQESSLETQCPESMPGTYQNSTLPEESRSSA